MDLVCGVYKYGFDELPKTAKKAIWREMTRLANWDNQTKVGNGGTVMLEWLTFVYTPQEWINSASMWNISLTSRMKKNILGLSDVL